MIKANDGRIAHSLPYGWKIKGPLSVRAVCPAGVSNGAVLSSLFLVSRYRGKTYRAVAKIVRTSDQVADFCRRVCAKLECCPNLFSPVLVSENCPENCSIHTKTKYSKYKE